jgi:hypothetical protein
MPRCLHVVEVCLRVLDRIRRELRCGMKCSEIITSIEEGLTGHLHCANCEEAVRAFRKEFIPLNDTVLPGDAHDCYNRISHRYGIKPTDV